MDGIKLLEGEKPMLFDEWQKILSLWDFIRDDIDTNGGRGQYLLTGSAKPTEDGNRHTGTGRFAKVRMRPMSLWESGDSSGQVSLSGLFGSVQSIGGDSNLNFDKIAELICRGGWPESVGEDDRVASLIARNYYASLTDSDITDVDGIKRNPERARRIMRAYARNVSSLASDKTIMDDISSNDSSLDVKTFGSYANALRKLFAIEDVPAWSPKLRSKTAMRSSDKRQFADPSIAAAALGAGSTDIMDDINTMGLLFESLCTRDLRVYAERLDGKVYHYRDNDGLEADAVVHLNNGDWGAIEIKLGGNEIDKAAENLIKLKGKIDTDGMREPKFLMVLTGLSYAYRREDGVCVVPIGCLRD
jgi:predicted AAA+ superfamily ATPase